MGYLLGALALGRSGCASDRRDSALTERRRVNDVVEHLACLDNAGGVDAQIDWPVHDGDRGRSWACGPRSGRFPISCSQSFAIEHVQSACRLASGEISIAEVAEMFDMSRRCLTRRVAAQTGWTPTEFRRLARMNRAVALASTAPAER
jgi:AraC-like DNA-binding protein